MSHPSLALLHRAVLEESRRFAPYGWRLVMVGLLLFSAFLASLSLGRVGAPGLGLLVTIVIVDAWLLTLVGIGTFGGVIAEEKRDETWRCSG